MDGSDRQQMIREEQKRGLHLFGFTQSVTLSWVSKVWPRYQSLFYYVAGYFRVKVEYVSNNIYALSCSLALSGSQYSLDGY